MPVDAVCMYVYMMPRETLFQSMLHIFSRDGGVPFTISVRSRWLRQNLMVPEKFKWNDYLGCGAYACLSPL